MAERTLHESPSRSSIDGEALRRRWRERDQASRDAQLTPPKRPSASTPTSEKVAKRLHKMSLQYLLGRIATDSALGSLDFTNHAQFLALTAARRAVRSR